MFAHFVFAVVYYKWRRQFRKKLALGMVYIVRSKRPIKLCKFASLALYMWMSSLPCSEYLSYLSLGRETMNQRVSINHPMS